MNSKIIKEFDQKGRLYLLKRFLIVTGFEPGSTLAVCVQGKDIIVTKLENVGNRKVIGGAFLDQNNRIQIPKEIWGNTEKVEVFLQNGDLVLKEEG